MKNKKKHGRFYHWINHPSKSIYCFIFLSLLVGAGSYWNIRVLRTTEYPIDTEKNSANILFVSDCHFGTGTTEKGLEKIVQTINDKKADVVLFGGDIIDENTPKEMLPIIEKQFSKISSKYGKFAVEGESDIEQSDEFQTSMSRAGVMMLKDQTVYLYNNICLTGLRDSSDKDKLSASSYLKQLDKRGMYSLVLSHRPRKIDELEKNDISLVLSGHTKGGQYPVKNWIDCIANDLVYGQKKIGTMTEIVTSGTGGYGIPAKIIVPSEIVSIQLKIK